MTPVLTENAILNYACHIWMREKKKENNNSGPLTLLLIAQGRTMTTHHGRRSGRTTYPSV